jgi:N,N'-diacetylchitobiose transport system substrate-binding protein
MRVRRFSTVLAMTAATAVMSAACGGGDGGGGSASGEDAELTVWIMEGTNPDAGDFFADVSTAFTERTGAALDVQFVPWASAHDKFVTSIAGGTTPDVAEVGTTWAGEFAEAGALVSLDDFVAESDIADDLNEGLVQAGTIEGSLYGMPWYAGVRSVVYRTDLFEAAGVRAPTTWDEWVEVGTALKATHPDVIPMPVAGDNEYGLYPFIWGNGGEIATEDDGTWTSQIDSPESREGIAFYTGLATEHGLSTPAATTWKETDLRDAFVRGDAAMILSGSWTPKAILEAAPQLEGKIGAFPIPGPDGGLSPSFTGGSLLSVFETTDDKDLAWDFVDMISTGEFATQWAEATSFFPGIDSLLAEAQASDDPLVQPFARQMVEAGASVPVTPAYGQVQARKTVQAMLQSILSGAKTVEQATSDAAAEMDETLAAGSS